MNLLLKISAVIEAATGAALIACPSLVVNLLLGSPLDIPVALTLGRVAGTALLALGVACWLGSKAGNSPGAKGLVTAMTLYNASVCAILLYAGLALGQTGFALWPAIILHAALTFWCLINHRPVASGS